ncbi:flagellar biosynthesis protein FlhA [Parvibium lacunae]|uniref:Flagellar biosynthesis protein FlhA n=1 Tax=Parvibium lacunae TaxID=1888893 RepID=A0A368L4Y3_9BURK|nr:flagellar biosynthesis protein FlhA [Parvibium lacunae]RCS58210.1 flagellar biosynthesis protein FlhA [Parvibium lacunae]
MSDIAIGPIRVDLSQARNLGAPIFIMLVLAMMVLPLPPFILDLLFTFNIGLGLLVLLASMYTTKPLDFLAFPTILLLTTLLRLSLNVASTRVVLLHGHTGPDAAGKVIEAFGHFLVGGNFAVGIIVFVILMVINFIVITKGAGRIAEVSARFTLDAMPGKQMAIDADLNAGLIKEDEAKRRRTEITQEAEFYGSMDGASKFVRGDAIAGILILFINIIGGLIVGIVQHDMSAGDAANNYVLLAIGDGLVAQIPALVISVAAGLVVSRVGDGKDIGSQVAQQLLAKPQVLMISGGVIGALGLIPNMPHLVFLIFAAGLVALGWWQGEKTRRQASQEAASVQTQAQASQPSEQIEASWDDIQPVDMVGLEVGYRLIPLVDRGQDGDLLKRIKGIRKKFAQEIGFLPPAVHIRDNLELRPSAYRVLLKGVEIGVGEVFTDQLMAINPGSVSQTLSGTATKDPAFGLPAIWIDKGSRDQAQMSGYTVVDASTVVATHISHLLHTHAAELLGRSETQALLEHFTKSVPKLVEDLTPKLVPLATVQRVLQNLLDEGVHLRDLRTIIETLCEQATRTTAVDELTAAVRIALARSIVQSLAGHQGELNVLVLDPNLERIIQQTVSNSHEGMGLEPGLADTMVSDMNTNAQRQEALGQAPVLLVPDKIRLPLARMFKRAVPRLRVLAHAEIPESRSIKVSSVIGARA